MKQVKTGLMNPNKNASFVAIYARDFQPFLSADVPDSVKVRKCSVILMLNRWDGSIGFVGGNVDGNETLIDGAIRESNEEINLKLTYSMLEPIVSHDFFINNEKTRTSHLFASEVSISRFLEIEADVRKGRDFGSEIMGSVMVLVDDFGNGKGFPTFLNSPMAPSVKEELIELISQKSLARNVSLKDMLLKSKTCN